MNIFFSDGGPNPTVQIADFGLATKLDDGDLCSPERLGTVGFMAPEVA